MLGLAELAARRIGRRCPPVLYTAETIITPRSFKKSDTQHTRVPDPSRSRRKKSNMAETTALASCEYRVCGSARKKKRVTRFLVFSFIITVVLLVMISFLARGNPFFFIFLSLWNSLSTLFSCRLDRGKRRKKKECDESSDSCMLIQPPGRLLRCLVSFFFFAFHLLVLTRSFFFFTFNTMDWTFPQLLEDTLKGDSLFPSASLFKDHSHFTSLSDEY